MASEYFVVKSFYSDDIVSKHRTLRRAVKAGCGMRIFIVRPDGTTSRMECVGEGKYQPWDDDEFTYSDND